MTGLDSRKLELAEKYNIDFSKLEKEQLMLSKGLDIKDSIDNSLIERYGGVDITFIKNKILCCIIICNKDFEVIDKSYIFEKVKFPYIPGFRSFRELPSLIKAYESLNEKPDILFVPAQGIIHPRLGLASHLGLSIGIPVIGISNSLIDCKINGDGGDGDNIMKDDNKVGRVLVSKIGSKPMYVSPGNLISVNNAYDLSKKLINLPHKRPEPLHLAGKYSKSVRKELGI